MAWTAPMTAVANTAFTAAQFNTHVRDNLLETAPAKATAAPGYFVTTGLNQIAQRVPSNRDINTSQTTASTSFTDLTSFGPSLTVTTGTRALVIMGCQMFNNATGAFSIMGLSISGATTVSATDNDSLNLQQSTAGTNQDLSSSFVKLYSLTAGSNTFTTKYRVTSGTGTFSRRKLIVIPF